MRKPEQEEILRADGRRVRVQLDLARLHGRPDRGARGHGATLAFDAIGGGKLASQILTGMEVAATPPAGSYSRYGSTTHKQVYIYGGLDRGPTELNRSFGMAWGIGGWLLTPFLQKIGPADVERMREQVAAGLKTTFASSYTAEVSLAGALPLDAIAVYGRQATGSKYLITPNRAA